MVAPIAFKEQLSHVLVNVVGVTHHMLLRHTLS